MGPVGFPGSAREGPERCRQRPSGFQGGPRESGSGPREPFLEGPGSAKVRQGLIFDGKSWRILRYSFFALNDFWKAPRGSRERGAEQQEFQRGAQGGTPISLWGPKGGPKVKREPWVNPVKTEPYQDGPVQGSEAPWENNYQR